MPLDPSKLPLNLRDLIPFAERWGVGDDFEREAALRKATIAELQALIESISDVSDEALYGWLARPESSWPKPSAEYLALSNLTLAIDSAKIKLKRRNAHR